MMWARARLPTLLGLLLAIVALGCGPATPQSEVPPGRVAVEPAPPPRDAAVLARQVVGAGLDALMFVDRLRDHPLAPRFAALELFGSLLEGTGIEPFEDVDRAFVAAKSASDQQAVIAVLEHHLEAARLSQAIDALVDKSGEKGAHLSGYGVPAARIVVRGRQSLVLAVSPQVLVVTSESHAAAAAKALAGTGGLPDPEGPAAIVANSDKPAVTLKARRVPPIPESIEYARAEVTLRGDGALLDIDAVSTSPDQARLDARLLSRRIEEASTMKISVLRIRVFDPIVFVAEGDHVKAHRPLDRRELEQLLTVASMLKR